MVSNDDSGFDYFVLERQSDLKRIARHTRGEYRRTTGVEVDCVPNVSFSIQGPPPSAPGLRT